MSRRAAELLERLRAGERIEAPVAAVVAHPDDETIGLGSRLATFADLLLIHVTDGAPLDVRDAFREGFATRQAYAEARRAELDAALDLLGVRARQLRLDLPDQGVIDHARELTARLAVDLDKVQAVVSHAYEGGHPDHDACALAVQAACARLGARAPLRLEFAAYHERDGRLVPNRFWPDPACPEVIAELGPEARARKAEAVACFRTQAGMLEQFPIAEERFRPAPRYDFSVPPPPGACLYDRFGFVRSSRAWREQAKAALAEMVTERVA